MRVAPRHINATDEHESFEICRTLAAADFRMHGRDGVDFAAHVLCEVAS